MVKLAIEQLKDTARQFRAWARKHPWPVFLSVVGLIAFLWVLIRTSLLGNMGFQNKSFWDWMGLLLVPAALALAGLWFSRVQKQTELEIASKERKADRQRARDRQRQNTLDAYLDKMTDLILERGLGPDAQPEVKRLARTRTIIALISLDSDRNRQVIQFLRESALLFPEPLVDLRDADLSGANLRGVDLSRVNLSQANLSQANLIEAYLSVADLSRANLREAELGVANFRRANLSEVNLTEADLVVANMRGAYLTGAFLDGADLSVAILNEADLIGASLVAASLRGTSLRMADLQEANLHMADLDGTDLTKANLEGATMPDGTKYEEWIKRQENVQEESHEQDD